MIQMLFHVFENVIFLEIMVFLANFVHHALAVEHGVAVGLVHVCLLGEDVGLLLGASGVAGELVEGLLEAISSVIAVHFVLHCFKCRLTLVELTVLFIHGSLWLGTCGFSMLGLGLEVVAIRIAVIQLVLHVAGLVKCV